MKLSELKYVLLPGHNSSSFQSALTSHGPLYEELFRVWEQTWTETFKDLKSEAQVDVNDFARQSVLSGLFFEERVKALLLFTFFDLRFSGYLAHPYIKKFPLSFVEKIRTYDEPRLMTMEYLVVDPSCRRSALGISIKDLLVCLGLRYFLESNAHSVIAVTRADRSINQIFYRRGGLAIERGGLLHNVEVDLIQYPKSLGFQELNVAEDYYVEQLWNQKMDLTDFIERRSHDNSSPAEVRTG